MNFPQNVVSVCKDKVWKDSSTMLKRVELVYKPYLDTNFFSLFALDKVSPCTCGITVVSCRDYCYLDLMLNNINQIFSSAFMVDSPLRMAQNVIKRQNLNTITKGSNRRLIFLLRVCSYHNHFTFRSIIT